jgi:hypothetical protein
MLLSREIQTDMALCANSYADPGLGQTYPSTAYRRRQYPLHSVVPVKQHSEAGHRAYRDDAVSLVWLFWRASAASWLAQQGASQRNGLYMQMQTRPARAIQLRWFCVSSMILMSADSLFTLPREFLC